MYITVPKIYILAPKI